MAKAQAGRLTVLDVKNAKAGRHADGAGLWLVVSDTGRKRWEFRFRWRKPGASGPGGDRYMGLGSFPAVGLADARRKAQDARAMIARGEDPIAASKAAAAPIPTFGDFAMSLIDDIEDGFRNAKHRQQWRNTLTTYCARFWSKPIDAISTEDVLAALKPIWLPKQETGSRVRGRIERVLDAARAKNLRSGENPARWRGHLDSLLPKRAKLQRGHHAAMPFADIPSFMARLREAPGASPRALEFLILTAARSGEVRGAVWSEFDLNAKVWTVPAVRMKAGREHRVPLSARAVEIVETMASLRKDGAVGSTYVFPGQKPGAPLSVMALDMLLRRLKVDVTSHGFRSSFRDWCGEETAFPREIAEAALAHTVGDAVERAYRRGDALDKRRALMAAWEALCTAKPAEVIQLRPARA
jgi:integrase